MFGLFQKVTDPVCKMEGKKNETKFSSEYHGIKYYFCSENCLNKFKEEPEKYLVAQEKVSKSGCC